MHSLIIISFFLNVSKVGGGRKEVREDKEDFNMNIFGSGTDWAFSYYFLW